jgi:hypothetical protein
MCQSKGEMTRRYASWLIACAASAAGSEAFFSNWLAASPFLPYQGQAKHENPFAPPEPDRWSHYEPQFFGPDEFTLLETITELLIPSDDTPGAKEAHVAPLIDFVVAAAAEYAPEMQARWRAALDWFSRGGFAKLPPPQQLALLEEISAPERDPSAKHDGFFAYRLIKDMTVHAFYTSRAGLVDDLQYQGLAYLKEFPACSHPEHHRV